MSFGILETVALAASVAGTAVSAVGSIQAGKAQEEAAAQNAANQRAQAEAEQSAAEEQMRRERANNRERLSTMRAKMAMSGASISQGSPLAALGETAGRLELGVQDFFQRSREQYAARQSAAAMGIWEGGQASSAANTQAFGTVLSGATKAGSMVSSGRNLGLYGGTAKYDPNTGTPYSVK